MRVKALKSFSGKVSMYKGEEREIVNDMVIRDLTQAGYIEQITAKRSTENEDKRDNDQ